MKSLFDPFTKVEEVARMGLIKYVTPDTTLFDAAEIMADYGIRHLPVVSEDKSLYSLISIKDVIDAIPTRLSEKVGNKKWVIATKPDEAVWAALKIMRENDIGALPVIDEEGKLLGIFTERDVVEKIAPEIDWSGHTSKYMTKNVKYVEETATLMDVIDLMKELKIRHVPIVEDVRPHGVVTALDVADYITDERVRKRLEQGDVSPLEEPALDVIDVDVPFVKPDTDMLETVNTLARSRKDIVIVIGDDYKLIGLLTDRDVLKEVSRVLEKVARP